MEHAIMSLWQHNVSAYFTQETLHSAVNYIYPKQVSHLRMIAFSIRMWDVFACPRTMTNTSMTCAKTCLYTNQFIREKEATNRKKVF